jgi:hypothetical protein
MMLISCEYSIKLAPRWSPASMSQPHAPALDVDRFTELSVALMQLGHRAGLEPYGAPTVKL